MSQVALIIALADRALADAPPRPASLDPRQRMTRIVAELLERPEYAAAAVDLGAADMLVAAAIVAFYP